MKYVIKAKVVEYIEKPIEVDASSIEEAQEKITGNMPLAEVVSKFPETAPVFFKHGMSCIGCPMAMQETIEQGAKVHGISSEKLVKDLNARIKKKK